MLLNCTKLTHELLIQYLQLDSFEEMLTEVDESVQIQSVGGRILSHTIQEFIDDFIPNFAYNSVTGRFVRSPCKFVEPIVRANHNKASPIYLYGSKALGFAFHTQNSLYSGFIGEPHFTLIVKIIGRKAIPFIIGEVKRHVDTLVKQNVI